MELFAAGVAGGEVLQWGRGLLAAEMRPPNAALTLAIEASMGPRFISRGNLDKIVERAGESFASMGPRFISRGNSVTGTWLIIP